MASSRVRRSSLNFGKMYSFIRMRSVICLLGPRCPSPFNSADGSVNRKPETLRPVLVPRSRRAFRRHQHRSSIRLMLVTGPVPTVMTMSLHAAKLAGSARRLGRRSLGTIRFRSVSVDMVPDGDHSPFCPLSLHSLSDGVGLSSMPCMPMAVYHNGCPFILDEFG